MDTSFVGLRDAGHHLEGRAFARPVPPDDTVGAAARHGERHVLQRVERLLRVQVADEGAREDRALQRGELLPPRVSSVRLRDVGDFDGDGAMDLGDGNGRVEPGETVRMTVSLINPWRGAVQTR